MRRAFAAGLGDPLRRIRQAGLGLSLLAFFVPRQAGWWLAVLAMLVTLPALVLYNAGLAVFAVVLAGLRLVRATGR